MIISRKFLPDIEKQIINTYQLYNQKLINDGQEYMQFLIENEIVNTFDLITIVRKYHTIKEGLNNKELDKEKVRVNCIYLTHKLKKYLDSIGLKTTFLTYEANGFSTKKGNKVIKEAHVSLLYTSKKGDEIMYTIFDPGLRINEVLQFKQNEKSNIVKCGECSYQVIFTGENNYPYQIDINNFIDYNYKKKKLPYISTF